MTILAILETLAATTKRKEKEKILTENSDNSLFKRVFYLAYNPDLVFYIKKDPGIITHSDEIELDFALDVLEQSFATREVTGNAAVDLYASLLNRLKWHEAEVLKRVVERDLRCGVSVATINKIWENLIPDYSLALASTDPSKLEFPNVCVQIKYDGLRCLAIKDGSGNTVLRTRNGKTLDSLDLVIPGISKCLGNREMMDGEIVCFQDGKPMSRQMSNGILNKAIRGTISPAEQKLIRYQAWDLVDLDRPQEAIYGYRFHHLRQRLSGHVGLIVDVVGSQVVSSLEEIQEIFDRVVEEGHEGVIAKNLNAVYEPKRTKNMVKFKLLKEQTIDLEIVGLAPGRPGTKYEHMLGALQCVSADRKIQVDVGTGFKDEDREQLYTGETIGQIVEVCYNQLIDRKDSDTLSLYLPVYMRMRPDKSTANTLEEITGEM